MAERHNRKRVFRGDQPLEQINIKIDPVKLQQIDEFFQENGFANRSAFIHFCVDEYMARRDRDEQAVSIEEQVLGVLQGPAVREKLREILKDLVFEQAFRKQ